MSELFRISCTARVADKLFDRARIRRLGEERFSSGRMAADYLRLYRAAQRDRAARLGEADSAAGA